MFHVGLDIHSTRISICVLSDTGQVAHRSQVRGIEEMIRTLKGLPDRFEVCYEASCGYGHYHDVLSPLAARVVVAHPGQLRLIFRSKSKNDRNDAERLAKLLYLGETPTVHVPAADVRMWGRWSTAAATWSPGGRGRRTRFGRFWGAPAAPRLSTRACGRRLVGR